MKKLIEKIISLLNNNNKENNNPFDLEVFLLQERLVFEYEVDSIKQSTRNFTIRLAENPDYKLTDILKKAGIDLSNCSINISYSITEDFMDKECHIIENIENYNILSDYLFKDSNGNYTSNGQSRSVIVYIGYTNNGRKGFIILHFHPWGQRGENMSLMSNISIYNKEEEKEDKISRCLLVFDLHKADVLLKKIKDYRAAANKKIENNKDLDFYEALSLNLINNARSYEENGNKYFENGRWRDAIEYLTLTHKYLSKRVIRDYNETIVQHFINVCNTLGQCYYNRELYKMASYYWEQSVFLAEDDAKEDIQKKLDTAYIKLNDIRKPDCHNDVPKTEENLFGTILKNNYNIIADEVSFMLWIDNETNVSELINDINKIWNLDLCDMMSNHSEVSIYLSYNKIGYRTFDREEKLTDITDKSILDQNRSVIVNITKKLNKASMTLLLPPPMLSDNNKGNMLETMELDFSIKPEYDEEKLQLLRQKAQESVKRGELCEYMEYFTLGNNKELNLLFVNGVYAYRNNILGDVLFYLTRALNILQRDWGTEKVDQYEYKMFGEVCYMLGFVYMELKIYSMAIYYLSVLYRNKEVKYGMEFINALTNSNDVRTFGALNSERKRLESCHNMNEGEKIMYESFLKRRYGYLLIEMNKIKEATQYFMSLLTDENCKEFAEQELDYLRRKYKN